MHHDPIIPDTHADFREKPLSSPVLRALFDKQQKAEAVIDIALGRNTHALVTRRKFPNDPFETEYTVHAQSYEGRTLDIPASVPGDRINDRVRLSTAADLADQWLAETLTAIQRAQRVPQRGDKSHGGR